MKEQSDHFNRQIVGRPYVDDYRMINWIKERFAHVRTLSFGERGLAMHHTGYETAFQINVAADRIFLSDFDGVFPDPDELLKRIVYNFFPDATEDTIRKVYDEMRMATRYNDPAFYKSQSERDEEDKLRGYIQLPGVFSPRLAYGVLAKIDYEQGLSATNWVSQVRKELRMVRRLGTMNLPEGLQLDKRLLRMNVYPKIFSEIATVEKVVGSKGILFSYGGDPDQPMKIAPYIERGIFSMAVILKERKHRGLKRYLQEVRKDHLMTRILQSIGIHEGVDVLYQSENIHDLESVLSVLSDITTCRGLLIRHGSSGVIADDDSLPEGILSMPLSKHTSKEFMHGVVHRLISGPAYHSR